MWQRCCCYFTHWNDYETIGRNKTPEGYWVILVMQKLKRKSAPKKAAKKCAENYEPKWETDFSFDELIAMSVNKERAKQTPKKKW